MNKTYEYANFRGKSGPQGDKARRSPPLPDRQAIVLKLSIDGMFWNVNKVIDRVYIAKSFRRDFLVRWSNSLYHEPGIGPENTWLKYFEQPFPDCKRSDNPAFFNDVFAPRIGILNSITQPKYPNQRGERKVLGLPRDRHLAAGIIKEHLHLQPEMRDMVERFIATQMQHPVIGLHIRGLGRAAGGTIDMWHFLGDPDPIPYTTYFSHVDRALEKHPTAKILVCSDSSDVIAVCRDRYGARVITYDATTTAFGEMHARVGQDDATGISPHKLGVDIIVEAYALSACVHLVHGNSNVSNFVLCNAPDMPHDYIYEAAQKAYMDWIDDRAADPGKAEELRDLKKQRSAMRPGSVRRISDD